jgi:hypothetical protein
MRPLAQRLRIPLAGLLERATAAARWRGPDGKGVPLSRWALVFAAGAAWSLLVGPREPVVILLPFFVGGAALWPGVAAVFESPRVRLWLGRAEIPIVVAAHAAFMREVFGPQLDAGVMLKVADHFVIIDHIRTISNALAEGRWASWTDVIQGGEPIGFLYPVFLDFVVAALHRWLGSGMDLFRFYTHVVPVCWCLRGLAVYALARRFAAPPIAGLLALASLLDVGWNLMDGNWYAVLAWGILESNVALTIAMFALAALLGVGAGRRGPRFVGAVLLAALAAVAHPMGLLVMTLSATALLTAALVSRSGARDVLWAAVAAALGLALASAYTMPTSSMLVDNSFVGSAPGNDFEQTGFEFLKGGIPDSSFSAFNGLAALAVLLASTTREARLVACALCALFLWLLELTPAVIEAGVTRYAPSLLMAQARRVVGAMKLVAVGPLAWLLHRTLSPLGHVGSTAARPVLTRALVAFVVLFGFGRSAVTGLGRLVNDLRYNFGSAPEIPVEQAAAFDWLAFERRADPNPAQWRVAILWKRPPHAAWAEGARTGVPVVDFRWVSGTFLTFRPREKTLEGFRDWAIRFVMTDSPDPPFAGLFERWRMGQFVVWENPLYDGRSVVGPPGVLIEGLVYRGDRIRFVVRGAPAGAEIIVRTAWFPRWRARQGGAELPVRPRLPRPDAKPKQEQIAVTARDGEVVLTCDRMPPRGALGLAVSSLGLLALVGAATSRRRERIEAAFVTAVARAGDRVRRAWRQGGARRRRGALVVVALAISAAAAASWFRGRRHLHLASWGGLGAGAFVARGSRLVPCSPEFWRGRWRCPPNILIDSWVGGLSVRDDSGEWPRLFPANQIRWAAPETELWLRFSRVRIDGGALDLRLHVVGACRLTVRVDGRRVAAFQYGNESRSEEISLGQARRALGTVELVFDILAPDTRINFDAWTR